MQIPHGTIKEFGEAIRTNQQNKSLHKYLEMVAHELSNQGQSMANVVTKLNFVEITPTKNSVKEIIFRPIMEAVVGKNTSRALTTKEIQEVYEIMSMFLSKQFEISLPWPSVEETETYQKSYEA